MKDRKMKEHCSSGWLLLLFLNIGCRAPSPELGAAVFRKNCAGCHSPLPGRQESAPALAGYFVRNPPPTSRQTRQIILNGRKTMPPFRNRLTSTQVEDVIAFLKTH
jgi:mono/diheme cytochrome c family protein